MWIISQIVRVDESVPVSESIQVDDLSGRPEWHFVGPWDNRECHIVAGGPSPSSCRSELWKGVAEATDTYIKKALTSMGEAPHEAPTKRVKFNLRLGFERVIRKLVELKDGQLLPPGWKCCGHVFSGKYEDHSVGECLPPGVIHSRMFRSRDGKTWMLAVYMKSITDVRRWMKWADTFDLRMEVHPGPTDMRVILAFWKEADAVDESLGIFSQVRSIVNGLE